jgi:hypothetical protein
MGRLLGIALLLAVAAGAIPSTATARNDRPLRLVYRAGLSRVSGRPHALAFQPRSRVSTGAALAQAAAATTIRMWHRNVTDHGTTFADTLVGKSPFVTQTAPSTTIKTYLVWIKITQGAEVFDPSAADPCDAQGVPALTRVLASPVFKKQSYTWGGTSVGSTAMQYTDAFQRAEFWKFTSPAGINPGYHVNLGLNTKTNVIEADTTVTGGVVEPAMCSNNKLLVVDFKSWDSFIRTQLLPALSAQIGPTSFPIFLVHNVAFAINTGCCAIGYHSAFGNPTQTYAVDDYDTSGHFTADPDVSVLSHEVAEWMNDPLVNNPTKPWGHIGQVSGCQSNLEVGDPLTGTTIPVTAGGFTYHPQELAFYSWFYHQTPSIAVNGWYSNNDTFTSPAAACA